MKLAALGFSLILLMGGMAAQTAAPPASPMHHDASMHPTPDQHMQEMKAQVEQMRATLNDMKANAATIKDSSAKRQAQLNTQLWEKMVAHLEGMVNMMSSHGAGGHAMSCCGEMKGGKAEHGAGMMASNDDCCSGMKEGKGGMSCCGEGGMSCGKPKKPEADSLHDHQISPPPPPPQ